jgi:hypothetical protein
MLLAGQPEIAIYVMLLVTLYYIFRVITEKPGFLPFLKVTFRFSCIVLLGLGLSAFLILPFLELISNSYHTHPLGGTMGTQDPAALNFAIGLLIPSFFTLPGHYRFFPHNGVWDYLGGYAGITMIYLILLGFFHQGRYRRFFLFFSLFGLAIILKNFGFPLISWIGRLPLLDQSWSPRWAGPVWTFSLAVASAMALEMFWQATSKKRTAAWKVLFFLLAIIGLLSYGTSYFSQFKGLDSNQLKAVLPPILGGLLVGVFIIFICTYLFIYCRSKKGLIYSIAFLAILELWFWAPRGMGFPQTVLKFVPLLWGMLAVLLLAREKWRWVSLGIILAVLSYAFIDISSPYGFPKRYDVFKEPDYVEFLKKDKDFTRIVAGEGILMPNFSSAFKVLDIRYINSLAPVYFQNYVDSHLLNRPHLLPSDRLWFSGLADVYKPRPRTIYQEIQDNFLYYSYLGVKYILAPKDISLDLPLVYDREVKIYENIHSFPRVYIAHKVKIISSYLEAQGLMAESGFGIIDTAILEEPPPQWYKFSFETAPFADKQQDQVRIQGYAPNVIKISANLKSDGVLVLTDIFYPGWMAYVDGRQAKIYRTNGLVRGIFLKKGRHNITFKYSPFSFKMGLIISWVSLALSLGLMLLDTRGVLFLMGFTETERIFR